MKRKSNHIRKWTINRLYNMHFSMSFIVNILICSASLADVTYVFVDSINFIFVSGVIAIRDYDGGTFFRATNDIIIAGGYEKKGLSLPFEISKDFQLLEENWDQFRKFY